jgi:hypothetical protein
VFLGNIAVIDDIYKTLSLKVVSFNCDCQFTSSVTTIINSFFAFLSPPLLSGHERFPSRYKLIFGAISANKGLSRMALASSIGTLMAQ